MQYYNINFQIIHANGFEYIDKHFLQNYNKTAVVLTYAEFNLIDKDNFIVQLETNHIDMLFLHEWSSWQLIPDVSSIPISTFIFHYDYTIANTNNRFYYPQWLLYTAQLNLSNSTTLTTDYLFSCASRNFNNGRPGKIYNYQMLTNKPYFKNILFTKYKSIEPFELFALPELVDIKFKSIVDNFLLDYDTWEQLNYTDLDLITSMSTTTLDVYTKSLFHIIAETRIEEHLLSEKTFKAFHARQILIMCGPQYAIQHLRTLGFDMFDDIIDHSYDNIANWQERIDAMHLELDRVVTLDHAVLLDNTIIRRTQNYNHLHSTKLIDYILKPIASTIIN
jgi:hypothetical protein